MKEKTCPGEGSDTDRITWWNDTVEVHWFLLPRSPSFPFDFPLYSVPKVSELSLRDADRTRPARTIQRSGFHTNVIWKTFGLGRSRCLHSKHPPPSSREHRIARENRGRRVSSPSTLGVFRNGDFKLRKCPWWRGGC